MWGQRCLGNSCQKLRSSGLCGSFRWVLPPGSKRPGSANCTWRHCSGPGSSGPLQFGVGPVPTLHPPPKAFPTTWPTPHGPCELSTCWLPLAPASQGPRKGHAASSPWPCPGNPLVPDVPGVACGAGRPHPWGPAEAAAGPVSGGGPANADLSIRPGLWPQGRSAHFSPAQGSPSPCPHTYAHEPPPSRNLFNSELILGGLYRWEPWTVGYGPDSARGRGRPALHLPPSPAVGPGRRAGRPRPLPAPSRGLPLGCGWPRPRAPAGSAPPPR